MPARQVQVVRALVWGALGAALFVGCTLDWTVRPDPGDASASEAGDERQVDGGPSEDQDATGSTDTSTDTPVVDAACDALFQTVETQRKQARACALASGQCAEQETELCDCQLWVAKKDSGAADAFRKAVAAFKQSGCTITCKGCQSLIPGTSGCVSVAGELLCTPDNRP